MVVALHGFTGSGLDFAPLAEHLNRHLPVAWIAPDLPGHGLTGPLPQSEAHSLPAMAAVLDRLVISRSITPIVLGYSMGGRLALEWATRPPRNPLSRLILVSTTAGIEEEADRATRRAADLALAEHIRAIGAARFAKEWEQNPIIQSQQDIPPKNRQAMQERRRNQDPHGLALSLEHGGTGVMHPRWNRLKNIDIPTMIVGGQNDRKFIRPSTRLAQSIPGAKTTLITGAGHCAHLENQNDFIDMILRFGFAKPRKLA